MSTEPLGDWQKAWKVLSGPWVLLPGLAALGLLLVTVLLAPTDTTGRVLNATLAVLASLLTGVAGGFLARRWSALGETGMLRAKGEGAVRDLNLIFLNANRLLERVGFFEHRLSNDAGPVLSDNLGELARIADTIREGIANAMEEWKDVVPSADVRAQIAERRADVSLVAKLQAEKKELQAEVEAGATAEERQQLIRQIAQLEARGRELRLKMMEQDIEHARSGTGPLPFRVATKDLDEKLEVIKCWQCEHHYIGLVEDTCPSCGANPYDRD